MCTKNPHKNTNKKPNTKRMYSKNKEKCLTCKMEKRCVCNKIEEIDNIIMAWRFSMCITCACQCKGESFDDLYESSNNCHKQHHKIIHSTTRLNIIGKFSAAVDYINACRMFSLKHYMDARYYLEQAILKSCANQNKLSVFVSENSKLLLGKINEKEEISENTLPDILTLSEILTRSENFTFEKEIKRKYQGRFINLMKTSTKKQKNKKLIDNRKRKYIKKYEHFL